MLTEEQTERMLKKLRRFEVTLEKLIFEKVGEAENVKAFLTTDDYHEIPDEANFSPIENGYEWGGEAHYCWFSGEYKVPSQLESKTLYLWPNAGGYEALLWVDGVPFGTFATKISFVGHGNHYCDMIRLKAKKGETIRFALEDYAGHYCKGCDPQDDEPHSDYRFTYGGMNVCTKNKDISDFYFDLLTVCELADSLPKGSERRGELINALYNVHNTVYYSYEDIDRASFLSALKKARPFLKAELAKKNGLCACEAGLIGHSHMDTAWLWHVGETVKKCARTYSNEMNLMEQYPEYTFVQSSSLHSEFIRENYPDLFRLIQKRVAEKRYEPNGGVWVECDCNITSGESMIRQFLWGQRFTRQYFGGYTSNCFWLPDTFGYSAAIPQIMKGCGVDYFLTTKIDWNDTNRFPYQTFWWEGIDGTRVFSHFNRTHVHPDPQTLIEMVDSPSGLIEKSVSNKRLISYGYGDGGGGPQFEMIEEARRCKDLAGCPRSKHTTVAEFMKDLEKTAVNPSVYRGELYLEIHRGTLTNQHKIKRNNRKCELALRDTEIFTVDHAVKQGEIADSEKLHPLYRSLLKNQFHDILPGTCIPRAHQESKAQTDEILRTCAEMEDEFTSGEGKNELTLTNTLSFDRSDPLILKVKKGLVIDGDYRQQRYTDLDGNNCLIVCGVTVPAFSSITLHLKKGEIESDSPFKATKAGVETPFAKLRFNKQGAIISFTDTESGRELKGEGYALNTFLVAEDMPVAWDNWDIDADLETKFKDTAVLSDRSVVSIGSAALVIRSSYRITEKSTITQDMLFFCDTKEVRFDTLMDWNDDHRFLKVAFDTSIYQDFARFDIQFGYAKRPTTRNTSIEKAKFEVLNHKYTDLSETRFGVSILNDCKYGISAEGGKLRLSLHKGGAHPDFTGDHGKHRCVYSFLPHEGDFSAERVTWPAYELNVPVLVSSGEFNLLPLAVPNESNVLVECVKPCEDAEKAFIVRLYECEGTATKCGVKLFDGAKDAELTNMLEEPSGDKLDSLKLSLSFHPFEIKTLKVYY